MNTMPNIDVITQSIEEKKASSLPVLGLSISSLNLFDNCPFSWMMKYVCHIKTKQTDKQLLGEQFQNALNAKYAGKDFAPLIKKMAPKMRGVATLLIKQAHDFEDIVSLDQKYTMDLGFEVPIVFVPDIITNDSIIENKFTTGYYNAQRVVTERQRVMYYLGFRKIFSRDTAGVYYQIFNTSKKNVQLIKTPTTTKDIDDLMGWMDTKIRQIHKCIETDSWDTGRHVFCDYPLVCPLMEKYGRQFNKSNN